MEKLRRGKDFSSSCLPAILTFSFSHPFPYPISDLLLQHSLQRAALSRGPPCLLRPRGKEMPERVLSPLRQSQLTASFLHLHCSMLPATSCCPLAMEADTKRQHCQKKRRLLPCPIQHPPHNQQHDSSYVSPVLRRAPREKAVLPLVTYLSKRDGERLSTHWQVCCL